MVVHRLILFRQVYSHIDTVGYPTCPHLCYVIATLAASYDINLSISSNELLLSAAEHLHTVAYLQRHQRQRQRQQQQQQRYRYCRV